MSVEHASNFNGQINVKVSHEAYNRKYLPKFTLSCSIVDKSVDKLWIRLWTSCGQLPLSRGLWKAVDKSASYPQASATYPHFCPQAFSHNHRKNRTYPHYPQPLLYIGVQSKIDYVPTTERI